MARWFADLAKLAEWGGPEIRFPLTPDQVAAWIAEGANDTPRICFTAVDSENRPVGHVQFLCDPPKRWARLGRFGIAPELRGKGFGRALLERAIGMAFTELDVEHLALAVAPTNAPALRLYLSAGFRDEGRAPGTWTVGGKPFVMNLMSLKRTDWLRTNASAQSATKVA
jgi:RimJ/RimL family protein N-acetyltransferase